MKFLRCKEEKGCKEGMIVSEKAFFVQSFARINSRSWGIDFLPQLVGPHKAKELVLEK